MNVQWFWKSRGKELGPFSTEELEKLVQRNRILPADQVRVADSEDWLSAAEIKAMFAEAATSSERMTPAEIAKGLLAGKNHLHDHEPVHAVPQSGLVARVMEFATDRLEDVWDISKQIVAGIGQSWLLSGIAQSLSFLFSRAALLVIVFFVLLGVVLHSLRFGDTSDEQAFARLSKAMEEMDAMQWNGASEVDQAAFRSKTTEWLEPALAKLRADQKHNVNQFQLLSSSHSDAAETEQALLDAGIALRTMLEAGKVDEPRKRIFDQSINRARDVLTGKSDYRVIERSKNVPTGATDSQNNQDPLFYGMILLDVAVVVGALIFFLRRRLTQA